MNTSRLNGVKKILQLLIEKQGLWIEISNMKSFYFSRRLESEILLIVS